jgi:hypothetical protein
VLRKLPGWQVAAGIIGVIGFVSIAGLAPTSAHARGHAPSALEQCKFKKRDVALALVAVASPSECSYVAKSFGTQFVRWNGSYPTRCAWRYPPRRGWTFAVQAQRSTVGREFCSAEAKTLAKDGWIRTR